MLALFLACAVDKPVLEGPSIGSCSYNSPFSGEPECRDFYATDEETAQGICDKVDATFKPGDPCPEVEALGACIYEDDGVQVRSTVAGSDATHCGSNKFGCETFAKGYWEAAANCDGADEIVVLENPFPQPELVCVDPGPDEPPGHSADGQVCAWNVVSGATEEGRRFSADVGCSAVIRQRGYSAVPPNDLSAEADARMDDTAYVTEVDWVRSQFHAGSCDCCHSSAAADGAAIFDADFDGNLMNTFSDRGLAMGAGWVPTVGFGTYPPEQNNGFERSSPENPYLSAFPTTDQTRMQAIFAAELEHRGRTKDEFADDTYSAGPLDEQLNYVPERCSADEGVAKDGTIRWLPGRARYIYVLEADAANPTVPPNLDLPDGTLWRVDLPADGSPVNSETVKYGEVPEGMTQVFPAEGAPEPLVAGKDYYLYVSADVVYPISRCIFTAGEEAPAEGCDSAGGTPALLVAGLAGAALLGRRRR